MALLGVQAIVILFQIVVARRKAFFRLGVLFGFLPISLHDLLHATSDGFRS